MSRRHSEDVGQGVGAPLTGAPAVAQPFAAGERLEHRANDLHGRIRQLEPALPRTAMGVRELEIAPVLSRCRISVVLWLAPGCDLVAHELSELIRIGAPGDLDELG